MFVSFSNQILYPENVTMVSLAIDRTQLLENVAFSNYMDNLVSQAVESTRYSTKITFSQFNYILSITTRISNTMKSTEKNVLSTDNKERYFLKSTFVDSSCWAIFHIIGTVSVRRWHYKRLSSIRHLLNSSFLT